LAQECRFPPRPFTSVVSGAMMREMPSPRSEQELPTLLFSRARGHSGGAGGVPAKGGPEPQQQQHQQQRQCRGRRPAPAPLELPEEEATMALRVKNTFIEGCVLRSPSLEAFLRERGAHTCPSTQVGLLLAEATVCEYPRATPHALPTPCYLQSPCLENDGWMPSPTPCEEAFVGSSSAGRAGEGERAVLAAAAAQDVVQVPASDIRSTSRTVLSLASALDVGSLSTVAEAQHLLLAAFGAGAAARQPAPVAFTPQHMMQSCAPMCMVPMPSDVRLAGPPRITGSAASAPRALLELPSAGSLGHSSGHCRPCAFLHTKGCENGLACQYCHICGPEERKHRRREKAELRTSARQLRRGAVASRRGPL